MIFIYFDPDIWGTVSDWFMVIVTIVTAFYLYKTLQSQKNVQETQNKLFEIETIRFRESIKPVLKYSISREVTDKIQKGRTFFKVAIINETSNIALEIKSDYPEKNLIAQVFATIGFPKFHLKKDEEPWFLHFVVE
jgi:hypothetical protein